MLEELEVEHIVVIVVRQHLIAGVWNLWNHLIAGKYQKTPAPALTDSGGSYFRLEFALIYVGWTWHIYMTKECRIQQIEVSQENEMESIFSLLKSYVPPDGWSGILSMLPEDALHYIYEFITDNELRSCIELGTGFGGTSCVMAAALQKIDGDRLITVDRYLPQPVNVKVLMRHFGFGEDAIEVVVDNLGYNWYLGDLIRKQTHRQTCTPVFDFAFLDGAHEWEPDTLAFTLGAKLLKPGGWIAIDDIDFCLRMIPNWQESYGNYTGRELDTYQLKMVYELVVQQHPDFGSFHLTHNGRIAWARKKSSSERFWKSKLFKFQLHQA